MTIRKKTRFEVFKRDSFTCQYCGNGAPDVILHVDHIEPVSKGGTDEIINLVTSCQDCNLGKGARELSDDAVISKQRAQLEILQERREQLEMMLDWQKSLIDLESYTVEALTDMWNDFIPGRKLNENGIQVLKKALRKYSIAEITEAMKIAAEQYIKFDAEGNAITESCSFALNKLCGICYMRKNEDDDPGIHSLYYIRGIARNRFSYCDDRLAIKWLRQAYEHGLSIEWLKDFTLQTKNWTAWRDTMEQWDIAEAHNGTR